MSIYEGTITLRVRFAADNGDTADDAVASIAGAIQEHWHADVPRDEDGEIDEQAIFETASSLIVDWHTSTAYPAGTRTAP